MRVLELWRYPVKSLQGERLDAVAVGGEGLEGDRRFALFDLETGFGLTARRVPELLFAGARLTSDGGVEITLPDGSLATDDGALSDWLGRPVALRRAEHSGPRRYENPVDFERERSSRWEAFTGAPGPFHDSRRTRVSLVCAETLRSWDRRRFRSNVLLDGGGEDGLVGSAVRLGEATLAVGNYIERCVMVTRPQPDGIDRDLAVLRTIARERNGRLAIGALVREPGTVHVGDVLEPAAIAGPAL
ncbi:MAG: MOSC N-terminal beta barrel domain-containing protein [Solirubrobacterales bacterium]|nr:MOSC N-terminal beta barrel domain-containing protein [Solirubrobacterales bacterium]MBV9534508.1 MOSC N-terminal beta barrel domain-containing protein [Solirubrobacterales bacterium]